MGGGLGTRGVRSAAISSAALLFAILLFTFRTKVQLFSANEGLLLSVAARDGSQTRIRPEQKKNAREHKLDEYMKQRKGYCDEQGKWTTLTFDENESEYKNKKVIAYSEYADSQFDPTLTEERPVVMQTCEIEDEDGESGWIIHRIGPMVGIGGYDRHEITVLNLPHPHKAKFFTGKMMAPVYKNGELAGFPPLHSHHVMLGFSGVKHAFESHGDAPCSEDLGGESCYLISYPDGYGLPLINESVPFRDELMVNFIFNDVRRRNENVTPHPMLFYGEVALKWSANTDEVKSVSAAALHMRGQSHGYVANIVTKRPSLRWSTGTWPVDGKVIISPEDQLPWFHAHRSYFTAFWAFAASPEELGLTTKLLRKVDDNNQTRNGKLDEYDLVWTPDDPIRALEEKVAQSKKGLKSLRCWLVASDEEVVLEFVNETAGFSPELSEPWQQNWKGSWYDRAGEVHCNPWSFKKGDSYTVVGMNGIDDRYNWTHDQSDFFTMMQHNILFLLYETTGPELGPTMEILGDFRSKGKNIVSLMWSYVPNVLKPRTEYYFQNKERQKEYEGSLTKHLGKEFRNKKIGLFRIPPFGFH